MKDAFGGAFIIRIMLVFFVIFIIFMTVAISWAKAFRIKSTVISTLERYVPSDSSSSIGDIDRAVVVSNITDYLQSVGYMKSGSSLGAIKKKCSDKWREVDHGNKASYIANFNPNLTVHSDGQDSVNGVCIIPMGEEKRYYYRVTTYFTFYVPLFDITLTVPISGETRTIKPDEFD